MQSTDGIAMPTKAQLASRRDRFSKRNLKAFNRKDTYNYIVSSAIRQLQEANYNFDLDRDSLILGLRLLGIKDHKLVEEFLCRNAVLIKTNYPKKKGYYPKGGGYIGFVYDHLRCIFACGIGLDDPLLIKLLHENLDTRLFQILVSEHLLGALKLNAIKVLNMLIDISQNKSNSLTLHILSTFDETFIPGLNFHISSRAFLTYLKVLERMPGTKERMTDILDKTGLFELQSGVDRSQNKITGFLVQKEFYNLDYEIQILLLKIIMYNDLGHIRTYDQDTSAQVEGVVAFGDVFELANTAMLLTRITGFMYADIWRLIKCVESLIPNLVKDKVISNFQDGSYLTMPKATRENWGTKAIAKANHLCCKGAHSIIEFTAATVLSLGIDWKYPQEASPKMQINFLRKICGAITDDETSLILHRGLKPYCTGATTSSTTSPFSL